jgi:hypothetical protein
VIHFFRALFNARAWRVAQRTEREKTMMAARRAAIRKKKEEDDEDENENENVANEEEEEEEEKKAQKTKKKKKKSVSKAVALSFEDEEEEEEGEETLPKKKKDLKKKKKKKKGLGALAVAEDGQDEEKEEEKRTYDAEALKKELEAQRRAALNRPKEHAQEEATTAAAAEANNPFSREAEGDDDVVQTADDDGDEQQALPSNKAILEAKLQRRAKQASGGGKNYIPLDVEQKKKTNAASLKNTMLMDIDDEEEDANEQRQQHHAGAPPSSSRRIAANQQSINKSTEERSNLALAKLQNAAQNAKRKLDACLENVERSNQASVRSSETLKSYEETLEESKLRYALAQELGVYFRALSGMLAEKLPMIEELEAQMLETVKTRGKKRKETREQFKIEIGAETCVALHRNVKDKDEAVSESELLNAVIRASGCDEVKMDELGRDVNLARKREVEKRCKSRFEAIKDAEGSYEKVVSDQFNVDEEDNEKKKKFVERVQSIADIAKNILFKDVDEEFASVSKILEKISQWESKDKKSHDEYLIYLADIFELFARVDLLKSRWITAVFCSSSSSSSSSSAGNNDDLVDFPWRNDIVEYVSASKRPKGETDSSVVALTNLSIEVYSRTIASLFAKCIDDENVWDVFEKPDRIPKSIQRVCDDMYKTIQSEADKKDETKGDKDLIDLSHLREMITEVKLGIQRRLDDAVLSGEYPFWNEEKYAALDAPSDRKTISNAFKAWKEKEESSLEFVAKTLEFVEIDK